MEEPNNINCKQLTINFIKREKGNIFIETLPFLIFNVAVLLLLCQQFLRVFQGSLTYLRGLEISELKEEDMPMVQLHCLATQSAASVCPSSAAFFQSAQAPFKSPKFSLETPLFEQASASLGSSSIALVQSEIAPLQSFNSALS